MLLLVEKLVLVFITNKKLLKVRRNLKIRKYKIQDGDIRVDEEKANLFRKILIINKSLVKKKYFGVNFKKRRKVKKVRRFQRKYNFKVFKIIKKTKNISKKKFRKLKDIKKFKKNLIIKNSKKTKNLLINRINLKKYNKRTRNYYLLFDIFKKIRIYKKKIKLKLRKNIKNYIKFKKFNLNKNIKFKLNKKLNKLINSKINKLIKFKLIKLLKERIYKIKSFKARIRFLSKKKSAARKNKSRKNSKIKLIKTVSLAFLLRRKFFTLSKYLRKYVRLIGVRGNLFFRYKFYKRKLKFLNFLRKLASRVQFKRKFYMISTC